MIYPNCGAWVCDCSLGVHSFCIFYFMLPFFQMYLIKIIFLSCVTYNFSATSFPGGLIGNELRSQSLKETFFPPNVIHPQHILTLPICYVQSSIKHYSNSTVKVTVKEMAVQLCARSDDTNNLNANRQCAVLHSLQPLVAYCFSYWGEIFYWRRGRKAILHSKGK